jgi:hypothetical protein
MHTKPDAALFITIMTLLVEILTRPVANSFAKALAVTGWHSNSILSKGTSVWWYNI